jgi:hypothetical protein
MDVNFVAREGLVSPPQGAEGDDQRGLMEFMLLVFILVLFGRGWNRIVLGPGQRIAARQLRLYRFSSKPTQFVLLLVCLAVLP